MIPVTLVEVDTQKVTKILTPERDGYHGIQVGYYQKPEKRLNKADAGRLRKAGINDTFVRFTEFRLESPVQGLELGTSLSLQALTGITAVDVTGISKGRGFQGAIKRWNSATGRRTHGSCYHRRTGSIGSNTDPGRVLKNKKMPGHLGQERVTIQNLRVMDVDVEKNVIALKGSVPGYANSYLVIKPCTKTKKTSGSSSQGE